PARFNDQSLANLSTKVFIVSMTCLSHPSSSRGHRSVLTTNITSARATCDGEGAISARHRSRCCHLRYCVNIGDVGVKADRGSCFRLGLGEVLLPAGRRCKWWHGTYGRRKPAQ